MAERLIDVKAFEYYINILYCSKCETLFDNCRNTDCWIDKARRTLEALPTIEAKPVVHAHWNADGRCTNCGEHAPFFAYADDWYETKYCHGCGAQMDESISCSHEDDKPIPQTHENGVKIPVISMEDVPKLMEELPSVEENPILKAVKEMEK